MLQTKWQNGRPYFTSLPTCYGAPQQAARCRLHKKCTVLPCIQHIPPCPFTAAILGVRVWFFSFCSFAFLHVLTARYARMHDAVKSLLALVFILNHQSFWPALPCLLTLRQSFLLVIFFFGNLFWSNFFFWAWALTVFPALVPPKTGVRLGCALESVDFVAGAPTSGHYYSCPFALSPNLFIDAFLRPFGGSSMQSCRAWGGNPGGGGRRESRLAWGVQICTLFGWLPHSHSRLPCLPRRGSMYLGRPFTTARVLGTRCITTCMGAATLVPAQVLVS